MKKNTYFVLYWMALLSFCILLQNPLKAQDTEADSLNFSGSITVVTEDTTDLENQSMPLDQELGEPTRAALLAALIPGLGQAFNDQYWKIPFVYGGYVVFASLIDFNHVRYIRFRDALALASDNNDNTAPEGIFTRLSNDQLRRGRDRYRRDRDFNIILTFMWYGLTIADATVDSHLRNFDISEDLAASLRPGAIDNDFNIAAAGVTLTIYLKP